MGLVNANRGVEDWVVEGALDTYRFCVDTFKMPYTEGHALYKVLIANINTACASAGRDMNIIRQPANQTLSICGGVTMYPIQNMAPCDAYLDLFSLSLLPTAGEAAFGGLGSST